MSNPLRKALEDLHDIVSDIVEDGIRKHVTPEQWPVLMEALRASNSALESEERDEPCACPKCPNTVRRDAYTWPDCEMCYSDNNCSHRKEA